MADPTNTELSNTHGTSTERSVSKGFPSVSVKCSDLIGQFSGRGDFAEWIRKFELVAEIQGIEKMEKFVPLFLTGGAFAVYDSLPVKSKENYKVRAALMRAFSEDRFRAYGDFVQRRLQSGEPVDVYLSDLRRLAGKVSGGLPEEWLVCAFVSGLPDDVSVNLKSACKLESMSLGEVVERARIVMSLRGDAVCAVGRSRNSLAKNEIRCYQCRATGHIKRFCPQLERIGGGPKPLCFSCGSADHLSKCCPHREGKNEAGNL